MRLEEKEQWTSKADGFAFVLPAGGAGNINSGPFARLLEPGDVLMLNLSADNSILVPQGEEFVYWYFSLRLEPLFPLFSTQEACQLRYLTRSLKTARYYQASADLAQKCHRLVGEVPGEFNFDHRSQLLRIAATVFSFELKQAQYQPKAYGPLDEQFTQVFEKLSVIEVINLSVGQLARKFNCSERHLNRLFHRQFGFSVASFKIEMRLLYAASLIGDTESKIINIAAECGFNHLGMFNSFFKRRFGVNPTHWRNDSTLEKTPFEALESAPAVCNMQAKGLCPWSKKEGNGLSVVRTAA
jgi:AraC-like DNA-binding protein